MAVPRKHSCWAWWIIHSAGEKTQVGCVKGWLPAHHDSKVFLKFRPGFHLFPLLNSTCSHERFSLFCAHWMSYISLALIPGTSLLFNFFQSQSKAPPGGNNMIFVYQEVVEQVDACRSSWSRFIPQSTSPLSIAREILVSWYCTVWTEPPAKRILISTIEK